MSSYSVTNSPLVFYGTLKMKTICPFETPITFHQSIPCDKQRDLNLQQYRRENPKSGTILWPTPKSDLTVAQWSRRIRYCGNLFGQSYSFLHISYSFMCVPSFLISSLPTVFFLLPFILLPSFTSLSPHSPFQSISVVLFQEHDLKLSVFMCTLVIVKHDFIYRCQWSKLRHSMLYLNNDHTKSVPLETYFAQK